MCKKFNYRKFYKEHYGIDFGPEYVIHHIDFNRENNDIDNLIMLPKGLHAKYRLSVNAIRQVGDVELQPYLIDARVQDVGHLGYYGAMVKSLADALEQMSKWVRYKAELDHRVFMRDNNIDSIW